MTRPENKIEPGVGFTAAFHNRRGRLLARTALCGVLSGFGALSGTVALALPVGGFAEVNAGGGAPVITDSPGRTDITLNAPRTVVSWNSFNVTPDEVVTFNFGARNWVVLNRVAGFQESRIEGIVEGKVGGAFGGNIWFVSQNSIIIGRGARIDAGGLLFAIGTPNTTTFLDPANNTFSFNGGDALPGARLWVLANAKVSANGGMVAFAAPTIVTRANATVTATQGSVLYGSAKTFNIRLAPGAGGDFDLVDFIVPDVSGGSEGGIAVDLAGETRANAVFVAAVSKSAIGSAVINLEGMVTAQAAKAEGGDIILSGGGGIVDRVAAPQLSGAARTSLFLNRASASRDLQIQNTGQVFARPWVRPPAELKDPLSLQGEVTRQELCAADPNCSGNGFNGGNGFGGGGGNGNPPCNLVPCIIVEQADLVSTLFDPTAVSTITAGRDARIQATASIELGRIIAGRDVSVAGPDISANSLIAAGNMSVTSSQGVIELAGIGVGRDGVITGKTDVSIDAISAPQKLTVNAGGGIVIGDGVSSVAGAITLNAAQGVSLDLASARIDTITAGTFVNLKGGALDIGTVTAPRFTARSASLKIGTANSTGDIYAVATAGDAIVGTANAGDDVYVLATNGTASLGVANLSGNGQDVVGNTFAGNPDASGNGRVVQVQSTDLDARLGLGTGGVTGATTVNVLAGRDAVVDVLTAIPGAFKVTAVRDLTLKAPTVTLESGAAGRDLTLGSTVGDFTLLTRLTATRNITVTAAGALRVGDVAADAGSVSLSGSSVQAGNVSASEDLILRAQTGGVTTTSYRVGRDLIIQGSSLSLGASITPVARDLSITSLGSFTSTTPLIAGRNVSVTAAGALQVGDVRTDAGSVALTGATVQTANVSASEDVTLRALSGGVSTTGHRVGRDLIIQATSLSLGGASSTVSRDITVTSGGNLSTSTALTAGRNLTLDVAGKATLGATSAASNVRIVAGDLDLTGALTSPTVQIESRGGGLRVGGAAGDTAGAMSIDNADFGQLRVSGTLRVFAGAVAGSVRGDLAVQNLTINPASTPNVAFLVGSANTARVTGAVAPTTSGGIIRIGDATNLSWRPNSILISGALGAATFSGGAYTNISAFDEVRLAARQDILIGSQRFITLIQGTPIADIDIAAGRPTGVAPTVDEQFKVFTATGKLEVSADNKVVQQNTAPAGAGQPIGIFLTGKFNPALIIDPPQLVELYGVVAGSDGRVIGGTAASSAITFTVVDTNGQPVSRPSGAAYRFNSCDVGTNQCTVASAPADMMVSQQNAGLLAARDVLSGNGLGGSGSTPSSDSQTSEEAGAAAVSSEALTSPPVLLSVAPADSDDIVLDPVVTGTGSEEIWRQRRQKK